MRKTLTAAALAALLIGGGTALLGATAATAQAPATPTDKGARMADALASLVADGTIDQAQADAIASAFSEGHGDRALRGGDRPIGGGDLAQRLAELRAGGQSWAPMTPPVRDGRAGPPAGRAGMADPLASLVADGTITQAQADAVAAALVSLRPAQAWAPGEGGGHGLATRFSGGDIAARAGKGRPDGGPAAWAGKGRPVGGPAAWATRFGQPAVTASGADVEALANDDPALTDPIVADPSVPSA